MTALGVTPYARAGQGSYANCRHLPSPDGHRMTLAAARKGLHDPRQRRLRVSPAHLCVRARATARLAVEVARRPRSLAVDVLFGPFDLNALCVASRKCVPRDALPPAVRVDGAVGRPQTARSATTSVQHVAHFLDGRLIVPPLVSDTSEGWR